MVASINTLITSVSQDPILHTSQYLLFSVFYISYQNASIDILAWF